MGVLDRPKKDAPWRNGVYLTTAKTSFEADIIASKLEAEGIPCVKNYRGASNFMRRLVVIRRPGRRAMAGSNPASRP